MTITLNQIVNRLKAWFDNHAQVNRTYYMDEKSFQALMDKPYTVANIQYLRSTTQDRMIASEFKITIADKTDRQVEGQENEVISDCLLIADGFTSFLQKQTDMDFNKNALITPFVRATPDIIAGVEFTVKISVVRSQNECAEPTKN